MTRPVRLRYTDQNGDEQLIGQLIGDQDTAIDQLQSKNVASGEYTHLEVMGNKDLLSRMPTKVSEFQENFEEIRLDVYSTSSGSWIQRDTVFAEDTGKIESDDGDYRNDQLFGLQKWVGREKAENIGPINTDLEDVLVALLNESVVDHTVQTTGTIPSVTNYSFTGNIDLAIRDILRDYPGIMIWWTGETDGSGNQIVKLEEKGANASVESITWPDPNYEVIEYEPEDTSIVVNRATVRGTNSNGDLIEVDTDDFASGQLATDIQNSKDDYGERSLPARNIGYLQDQAHAEEIAKNLLQLEAQPHLVISLPFQEQNILNQDIDITDDRYNINDTFTVVKQRDFYRDSQTEVELVFEKNLAEERRAEQRDISEERAKVYPGSDEAIDINFGDFNAENDTAEADSSTTGENDTAEADTTSTSQLDTETADDVNTDLDNEFFNTNISSSGWTAISPTVTIDADGLKHEIILEFEVSTPSDLDIAVTQIAPDGTEIVIFHDSPQNVGTQDSSTVAADETGPLHYKKRITTSIFAGTTGNYSYGLWMSTKGSGSPTVDGQFQALRYNHDHGISVTTTDAGHGGAGDFSEHLWSGTTTDAGHGGAGDFSEHLITGDQIQKLINLLQEIKTDR